MADKITKAQGKNPDASAFNQSDFEALKQYCKELEQKNNELTSLLRRAEKENKEREETVETFKKMLFKTGKTSEANVVTKFANDIKNNQEDTARQLPIFGDSQIFNEIESALNTKPNQPEFVTPTEPAAVTSKKKSKKKKKTARLADLEFLKQHLEVKTVYIDDEKDSICPVCHNKMTAMGEDLVRTNLIYVPAKYYLEEVKRKTYKCKECESNNRKFIFKKTAKDPLLPHSVLSPSLLSQMIEQKFLYAKPLYRQEQEMNSYGIPLTRNIMSSWCKKVFELHIEQFCNLLKEEILKTNFIHADETRIEVIRSKDTSSPKQCYMWVYTTTKWNPKQIRYFDYQNGRGGKFPEKFLKDYEGYIHTDCYGGYDNLIKSSGGKIKRCLCLVHLRRYFYQATDGTTNRTPTNLLAMEGISMLDEVFVFEKKYKDLAPNTRKKLRIENTKPILDKFFEWCQKVVESGFCLEKSKLSQALNYALKGKEEFMTFLEDGNCDISNNPVENAIRPFVIGRKNFLFNFTDNGAKVSAGYYSIIETAKHNGLDPRRYLEWLFNEIPQVRPRNNLEKLREFLPWSEKVPDSCKATAIDNSQDQNESC